MKKKAVAAVRVAAAQKVVLNHNPQVANHHRKMINSSI